MTDDPKTLDEAIQLAAEMLPNGSKITIECEEGAAWVVAESCDGGEWEQDAGDGSLADRVIEAIKFCERGEPL